MALQLIFGMTFTNLDDYLLFVKRIIVKVLRKDQRAHVRIPSSEKIEEYKEMVRNRHPFLTDVWCTKDGLKITLEQSGDALIQKCFYNGWTHGHYVSSVLCFCPDGTIPIAYVNIPGAVHDSQIADYGDIYDKLETVYQRDGGQCTIDSAFGNVNREFLIKSSQELIHIQSYRARSIACDATSMRQSAEWGMRAFQFQSSMPRIKDRMKFEERGERKVTLTVMILLYNLQARMIGINQLRSFYMGALYRDANVEFVPPLVHTYIFFNTNLMLLLGIAVTTLSPSLLCSVLLIPANTVSNMFTTPSFGTEPEAFRPIILTIIIAIMFC